ncbi:MAG: GbsR/MarR family transcriptional regulator [Flavobacteriales bacterium]
MSKIPTENTKTQWELEFSKHWVAAGAHWGVPKTTLAVHGWLMAQPQPVSTDEVMSALELSRGGAHNALQSLVDWKLAHAFKPLGARQVKYTAEDDPFAMLMAIIHKRRMQELVPLAELAEWNAQMKSELSKQGREDFHERLAAIAHRARQLDVLLVRTAREDEGWWWRWILGPLRTK